LASHPLTPQTRKSISKGTANTAGGSDLKIGIFAELLLAAACLIELV